jgi:hypothetical protein
MPEGSASPLMFGRGAHRDRYAGVIEFARRINSTLVSFVLGKVTF